MSSSSICETVQRMLANDQTIDFLGIEAVAADDGHARLELTVTHAMTNGHDLAHGGIAFSLADTTLACAANSLQENTVTSDATISYLTPARLGDRLVAEGSVVYRDGRRVTVDVVVTAAERTVALLRGNGRTLRPAVAG